MLGLLMRREGVVVGEQLVKEEYAIIRGRAVGPEQQRARLGFHRNRHAPQDVRHGFDLSLLGFPCGGKGEPTAERGRAFREFRHHVLLHVDICFSLARATGWTPTKQTPTSRRTRYGVAKVAIPPSLDRD